MDDLINRVVDNNSNKSRLKSQLSEETTTTYNNSSVTRDDIVPANTCTNVGDTNSQHVNVPKSKSNRKRDMFAESYVSVTAGPQKRDLLAAKQGFAVEFPLLCAKLGASVIPEVLVTDKGVSFPLYPIIGERSEDSSQDMKAWMPSNVDITQHFTSGVTSSGDPNIISDLFAESTSYDMPSLDECLPPSPIVHVQFDTSDNNFYINKFSMRGVQADEALIDALGICLLWYRTLHKVVLENCKLTAKTLEILAHHMRNAKTIRDLEITENPIPGENFHVLLEEYSGLEHLTLRMCEITDAGAALLSAELTYRDPPEHQSLLSLNLSSNKIGDEGIQYLADAMRTNRTLQDLILSQNNIGDSGAEALASIAMKFALKSDEIQYRNVRSVFRKNILNQKAMEMQMADITSKPSKKKTMRVRRPSKKMKDQACRDMKVDTHPYVWDARPDGTDLWCVGNVTLQRIGLGYNNIGVRGVKKILEAVKYQSGLKRSEGRLEIGISRVEIEGNPIPRGLAELNRLQEILSEHMREDKKARHLTVIPKTSKAATKPGKQVGRHHTPRDHSSTYTGLFKNDSDDSSLKIYGDDGTDRRSERRGKSRMNHKDDVKKRGSRTADSKRMSPVKSVR